MHVKKHKETIEEDTLRKYDDILEFKQLTNRHDISYFTATQAKYSTFKYSTDLIQSNKKTSRHTRKLFETGKNKETVRGREGYLLRSSDRDDERRATSTPERDFKDSYESL